MARKPAVDVAVIVPDASPVLTPAFIGRLDLLATFIGPTKIVDQVRYEVTTPGNDPSGRIAAFIARIRNLIEIV
jgi:hypothetical protein